MLLFIKIKEIGGIKLYKVISQEVKENLLNLADKKYKEFHSRLCPGVNNIIGIRVPVLRNYAKELAKKYKIEELIHETDNEYYEEIMLKGILIGLEKQSFNNVKRHIESFIPKIDNWAICDIFCAGLKITKKNKEEMWNFIQKYLNSEKEFEIRFGIVMILYYYIELDYLENDFKIFSRIKSKDYYAQMAVAWAISICLIKFYDETIEYIKTAKLSNFVYNKAIQKAIESYRITDMQKKELKKIKKLQDELGSI